MFVESVINEVTSGSAKWIPMAGGALALGGGLGLKGWASVKQKNVALVTHRERPERRRDSRMLPMQHRKANEPYGWVGPGFHPQVPFTHGIHSVNTGDRNSALPKILIDAKDEDRQYELESSLVWGVPIAPNNLKRRQRRLYEVHGVRYTEVLRRALFESADQDELQQNVVQRASAGLREIIGGQKTSDPRELLSEDLYEPLVAYCGEVLFDKYGVELRGLNVTSIARSDSSVLADGIARAGSNQTEAAITAFTRLQKD